MSVKLTSVAFFEFWRAAGVRLAGGMMCGDCW